MGVPRIVHLAQWLEHQLFGPCRVGLGIADVTLLHHQPQNDALPPLDRAGLSVRLPQLGVGIVVGGRLAEADNHGSLGQGELGCMPSEVSLGRGLDAVGQVAIVDLVQVDPEDRVFVISPRDFSRQDRLFHLTGYGPLGREVGELDELLGDGAAARSAQIALADGIVDRTRNAYRVHAAVGVEVGIFRGDGSVDHVRRHLVEFDRSAPAVVRVRDLVEDLPGAVVDQRRCKAAHACLQLVGAGQIARDAGVADKDDAQEQRARGQQRQERRAETSAPTALLRGRLPLGPLWRSSLP